MTHTQFANKNVRLLIARQIIPRFRKQLIAVGWMSIVLSTKLVTRNRKEARYTFWVMLFLQKNRCLEVTTTSCAKDKPGLEANCKLECGNVDPGYALSTFDSNEDNRYFGNICKDKHNVKDFQDVRKLEKSRNEIKTTSKTHQNIFVLNPKNNQKSSPVSDSFVIMHDRPLAYVDVQS